MSERQGGSEQMIRIGLVLEALERTMSTVQENAKEIKGEIRRNSKTPERVDLNKVGDLLNAIKDCLTWSETATDYIQKHVQEGA